MANALSEDDEPAHESSATARVLEELTLFNRTPMDGIDPRPLPDGDQAECAMAAIFETLAGIFQDTCLEPDLDATLWSFTELFHKLAAKAQRQLDENEDRQKRSAQEQDGSEIRSVELEALLSQGQALLDRHQALEQFRDLAASHYEAETGSAWRPRAGSLISHRHMTAAVIDSREFLAARRRSQNELLLPKGPKIAFSGGADYNDHTHIWAVLDKVHAKHPDMVLIHGGTSKGAEKIAALWADKRKVSQIAFKPDWANDGKAAPFKRNDRMLEILPAGVVVFPAPASPATSRTKPKSSEFPSSTADRSEASAEAEIDSQLPHFCVERGGSNIAGPGAILCEALRYAEVADMPGSV